MNREDNTKNYLVWFICTILILLGYDHFYGDHEPASNHKQVEQMTSPNKTTNISKANEQVINSEQEKIIKFNSPLLSGCISSKGARIYSATLKKYKDTLSADSANVQVLNNNDGTEYAIYCHWDSRDQSISLPTKETIWRVDSNCELTPQTPVSMSWDNGAGIVFKLTYYIDDKYVISIKQEVATTSASKAKICPHITFNRYVKSSEKENNWSFYSGPIGFLGNKLQEIGYDKIDEDKDISIDSQGGWCGISDKYWLVSVIPTQSKHIVSRYTKNTDGSYCIDVTNDAIELSNEKAIEVSHDIFVGAKDIKILDYYEQKLAVKNLDLAIDFGYLYILTKPLLYLLSSTSDLIGNMGFGIILLTVLLKLILFPLANKSYRSMNRLKDFQPRIKRLQDLYKDDKVRLGQEISELYKKEKINPAGGCLPALLQSPILFALYKVLYISIDMRHAPFIGWIHDLSMPDSAYILNLFGLIPVDLPSFLAIGIWPILMGLSMYIQQKISPQVGDQTQAKMMTIVMPIMFMFMFASLPAGLVIYWTWSNILGIAQQYAITKLDEKSRKKQLAI